MENNMENIKHNRQAITVEMIEDFMSKYRLATKEDAIAWIKQLNQTNDKISEEVLEVLNEEN